MSTETQKADVLAVMSDAAYYCLFECGNGAGHDAMQEARAAVAELIEAANRTIRYADSEPDGDQVVEVSRANIRDLRAALARVGGAA